MTPTSEPSSPDSDPAAEAARISIEQLKKYSIFPEGILPKLRMHVREEQYPKGSTILKAGTYNPDVYYVARGVVELVVPEPTTVAKVRPGPARAVDPAEATRLQGMVGSTRRQKRPDDTAIADGGTVVLSDLGLDLTGGGRAVLEEGEFFGENAKSRYPVATDVVAVTDVTCLLISTFALKTVLSKQADFKKAIEDRYRSRTLASQIRQISLFSELAEATIDRIVQQSELLEFDPEDFFSLKGDKREAAQKQMSGMQVVEQGTPGDALYLVVGGYLKVGVRAGAGELAVTYLRKGDFVGEVCLLMDEPWPFSLYALEHVELIRIDRQEVQSILATSPSAQRQLWEAAVKRLKQRGFALRNPQTSRQLQMAMDTGLIHGESVLLIDLNTCTRCDDCVRACADTHDGTPRFIREGLRYERWSVVTACYQCTDPVCMVRCPTNAITRALGTLEVTIDDATCVGCEACAKSCPWDNITMVPNQAPTDYVREYSANKKRTVLEGTQPAQLEEWVQAPQKFVNLATKCDLCVGRAAGPACVQMCPHGSAARISFKDLETVADTLGR